MLHDDGTAVLKSGKKKNGRWHFMSLDLQRVTLAFKPGEVRQVRCWKIEFDGSFAGLKTAPRSDGLQTLLAAYAEKKRRGV